MPQCGHRRQEQALLYPSFASAWAQEIGTSSSVPFFRLNVNSLWVWEACFVADTHTMKSLRVWEAYFAADTQIVKTGRYNKGTLYSKMFVVGVLYFGSIQKK